MALVAEIGKEGSWITVNADGSMLVPDNPYIGFIEGDGVGPDIWAAARPVIEKAVEQCYSGRRSIRWVELAAGEKSYLETGQWLPNETLDLLRQCVVAIKGPMTTPVGEGIRSLNVTLRQKLDLYACVRPVRYFNGVPSPVKNPEKVNMVVFRENTEDVYAGIEWAAGSEEAARVAAFLRESFGIELLRDSGIGIKPMSRFGSFRLVRRAVQYAIGHAGSQMQHHEVHRRIFPGLGV